jgi:hypothetical protein
LTLNVFGLDSLSLSKVVSMIANSLEQDQSEWQIEWQTVLVSAYLEPVTAGVGPGFT